MKPADSMMQHLNKGFDEIQPRCLDSILAGLATAPTIASEEELFGALPTAPAMAPLPLYRRPAVWGMAAAAACLTLGLLAARPALFRAPEAAALGVIYVDAQKSIALAYNTNHVVTDIFTTDAASVDLAEALKAEVGEDSTVIEALDTCFAMMEAMDDAGTVPPTGIISCRTLDSCSDSDVNSDQEYFSCQVVAHVQEQASRKPEASPMLVCQNVTSQLVFDPTSDDRNITPGIYYLLQWLTEHYDLNLNDLPDEIILSTDQLFTYLADQGIDISKDFQIINDTIFLPTESVISGESGQSPVNPDDYQALLDTTEAMEESEETSAEEESPTDSLQESANTWVVENTSPSPGETGLSKDIETPHYNPTTPPETSRPPQDTAAPNQPPIQNMEAMETTPEERPMESYADTSDRVIEYTQDSSSVAAPSITEIYETSREEVPVVPEIIPEESKAHNEYSESVMAPDKEDPTAPGDHYKDSWYENYSSWWRKNHKKKR